MNLLEEGKGKLYTNQNPDEARAFFRAKYRCLKNIEMDRNDAVSTYSHDGDYLDIGGFGTNRSPLIACHFIVRKDQKQFGLTGYTATHFLCITRNLKEGCFEEV